MTRATLALALAAAVGCRSRGAPPTRSAHAATAIEITAWLPGADAETVAASVATPLERALGQLAKLEALTSVSTPGVTTIRAEFPAAMAAMDAAAAVQGAIDSAAQMLPPSMPTRPSYVKAGELAARVVAKPTEDADLAAAHLSQIAGVGKVELCGGSSPLEIVADAAKLASLGMTPQDVADALQTAKWPASPLDRDAMLAATLAIRNGAPVKLGDVASVATRTTCRGFAATGRAAILTVIAQPGVDPDELRARLVGATSPPGHELWVFGPPGRLDAAVLAAAVGYGPAAGDFTIEQRDDDSWVAPVRVRVGGDDDAVAAVAAKLRAVPGVDRVGAPRFEIDLEGVDPGRAAAPIAKQFADRGALVAAVGLAAPRGERVAVDRDRARALGVDDRALDTALAVRRGRMVATLFTQTAAIPIWLRVTGEPTLHAAGGSDVPLSAIAHVEPAPMRAMVVHRGPFPAVRLYTTDDELGDVPPELHPTITRLAP